MSMNPLVAYGGATIYNWLRQVPREVLLAYPEAYGFYAWSLVAKGQIKAGSDLLDSFEKSAIYDDTTASLIAGARMTIAMYKGDPRIEEYARKVDSLRPPEDIQARAVIAFYLGAYYTMTRRYNEAEPLLSEAHTFFRQKGATSLATSALKWLAAITLFRGKLYQVGQMLKHALGMTGWNTNTALQHMLLGVVYYCWNDLEAAAAEREKANSSFPIPSVMGSICLYTAGTSLLQGDIGAAAEALEKAERVLIMEDATPEDLARVTAYHVALALIQDDQEAVYRWLDKLAEYEGPFLYDMPVSASHLLYERWNDSGRERLQAEHEQYHKEGYQYLEMVMRLEQALTAARPEEALAFLAEVLVMAQPEGNIRILADFGILFLTDLASLA